MQGELERALATILGDPVRIAGAGRTDAGVHATGQVISFRSANAPGEADLARGLNALLPADIAVLELERAAEDFHARFSATGRAYEYRIRNAPVRDPLERHREHWLPEPLDLEAMRAASAALVGRHEFAAFAAGSRGVRTVREARWEREGTVVRFSIEADAFLRGMVRGIVGTSIWVGRGKVGPERVGEILAAGDRSAAGPSAPPQGLCLVAVRYERGENVGEC